MSANARARAGFLLLPVALLLATLGAVAYWMSREVGLDVSVAGGERAAAEARYVAEAGLTHQLRQVQNASCVGYAALPSTPFGDHAYTTSVTPASGSPVTIQATATLASGALQTLTRSRVPVYGSRTAVPLQLDPTIGRDAALDVSFADSNIGGSAVFVVASPPSYPKVHSLLGFDLSTLPTSATVLTAWLELWVLDVQGAASERRIAARRVTRDWVEGTKTATGPPDGATWNTFDATTAWTTPGGDAELASVAVAEAPPAAGAWMGWDVTPLVAAWLSGGAPNHGLLLTPVGDAGRVTFASRENAGAGLQPRLTVTTACECGVGGSATTTTIQPGPTDGKDTYLDDGVPGGNFGGAAEMRVSEKTNSKDRALLRFDLGEIPPAATVSSAVLELNLEGIGSGTADTVFVHKLLRSWTESGASWDLADAGDPWSTPGADFDPTAVASAAIDPVLLGPVSWDVTALVNDWRANGGNEGVVLVGTSTLNHADFTSSDATANPLQRPKLTVTWSCDCGAACTTGPSGDYYLDEVSTETCDPNVDYRGSHGSLDWSPTAWLELGDTGNPCTGAVQVTTDLGEKRFEITGDQNGLQRWADLSGFTSAALRFAYRRQDLDSGDEIVISVSPNGGINWTELDRIQGPGSDLGYEQAAYDISAWATATTAIAITASGLSTTGGAPDLFYFDQVQIDQDPVVVPGGGTLTLNPVGDTWLNQSAPDVANGSATRLHVGKDAGSKQRRPLARFDVSGLPASATVTNAKLRLYGAHSFGSGSGIDVAVHRVTAPWDEATSTWASTGGGSYAATPLATVTVPMSPAWSEWAIPSSLIHEWRDGVTPNHGLILVYSASQKNRWVELASREHDSAGWHPQLVIDYTEP